LDRALGEPPLPAWLHPVALFGSAMTALEQRVYEDRAAPGALLAAIGVGLAGAAGAALGSPTAAGYLSTAGRGLHAAALDVAAALGAEDLPAARALLPSLVGRDPRGLDESGIARAAVESVAENTTDAIVAPALWTAAAGPVGAFVHRASDTLDSMVGYRDDRYRRFGLAAAQLDDTLAWAPARATALLVALARPRRARQVVHGVRHHAAAHPSPNAGVAEAAFAAALDLRLGGTNRYGDVVETRPPLGTGRPPGRYDIAAAVELSRNVTWLLAGLLAAAGAAGEVAARRRARLTGRADGPARGHRTARDLHVSHAQTARPPGSTAPQARTHVTYPRMLFGPSSRYRRRPPG
jgi:adenosylcobinamide-phosphate synthase